MKTVLRQLEFGPGSRLAPTVEGFLRELGGPALIRVPGRTRGPGRWVVTLLHGNEPSGVTGIHRFLGEQVLTQGYRPRTDLYFCIANVALALEKPLFSRRQHPGERDLNRCFLDPGEDGPGTIAAAILEQLEMLAPEAVLDIHNTSGAGPSFSVAGTLDRRHLALTSLFTRRAVITELGLGALIDISSAARPVVTIECGGARDAGSHEVAFQGIRRLASRADLFVLPPGEEFDIYLHPVRLELAPGTRITVADAPDPAADITLPTTIEKRNFGYVTPDIPLAWVNDAHCLRVRDSGGEHRLEDFFLIRRGRLHCAHPLKLFMVTTNPVIALSDCLLYAVRELDHSHLPQQ